MPLRPDPIPSSSHMPMNSPIAVAVSGGMDSLLALALLREQGHGCVAVHGRFLPPTDGAEAREAELRRACESLGAEFLVADLVQEFRLQIIEPFVRAYARGLTPNPCALCNPRMKFGLILDAAEGECGSEWLATGHYASVEIGDQGPALLRGKDPAKEQSYFLSLVPAERLKRAVFPLGGVLKSKVPGMLAKRSLTPPLAQESQEICFIPHDDYCAFLEGSGLDLPGPGPIVTREGEVLGEHRGLWRHTLGQRRGLGVAYSEPLYVLAKDAARNALVVGVRDQLRSAGCEARQVNVLAPPEIWPATVYARIRYRQAAKPATAEMSGDTLRITFAEPQDPAAPGQVAAIYDQAGRVLAAGIICA